MYPAFVFTGLMATLATSSAAAFACADDDSGATVAKQSVIADYAACVLRQHPERTRQLLATGIDSKDEYKIAKSLLGNQRSCTDVRNHVATALYDRAMASSGSGDTNA